jgi:hypothetical protein
MPWWRRKIKPHDAPKPNEEQHGSPEEDDPPIPSQVDGIIIPTGLWEELEESDPGGYDV